MASRYSVFKNGYVNEDGSVLEPLYIASGNSEASALKNAKILRSMKHNYHTVQEEFDGKYWVSVEGTEILY